MYGDVHISCFYLLLVFICTKFALAIIPLTFLEQNVQKGRLDDSLKKMHGH